MKCQKTFYVKRKTGFRITTEPTILALRNQTIWSGFLWYLATPSGKDYVHKPSLSQNKILVRVLSNFSLILILSILPEVKDFSKLKTVISSSWLD